MYFENGLDDAEALKRFLKGKLASICDADPDVLADYIVTLLKHDVASESEMREFCKSQLQDFLVDHTDSFLDLLFSTLSSRSYAAGGPTGGPTGGRGRRGGPVGARDAPPEHDSGRYPRHGRQPRGRAGDFSDRLAYSNGPDAPNGPDGGFGDQWGGPPGAPHFPDPEAEGGPPPAEYRAAGGRAERRGRGGWRDDRRDGETGHRVPAPPPYAARFNPRNTNSTLVMENIPEGHFSIKDVDEAFRKFGNVVNITLQPVSKRAVVHFATPLEAHNAYTNPESYFGNRFVKVYWFKDDSAAAVEAAMQEQAAQRAEESKKAAIAAHQEHVQQNDERKRQQAALLEQGRERQQLQTEFLERKRESFKQLVAMLETGGAQLSNAERADIMEQLRVVGEEMQTSLQTIRATTAAVVSAAQAVPAAAKARAPSARTPVDPSEYGYGVDAEGDEMMDPARFASAGGASAAPPPPQFRYSGGFRGRGAPRGAHRGAPRGAARGAAAAASRSLDLRPRKLFVQSADAATPEQINSRFSQYGSVDSVVPLNGGFVVTYSQRWEAEKAAAVAPRPVEGQCDVSVSWFEAPSAGAFASGSTDADGVKME